MTRGWGSIRFGAAQPGIAAALLPRTLIGTEGHVRCFVGFGRTISSSHVAYAIIWAATAHVGPGSDVHRETRQLDIRASVVH